MKKSARLSVVYRVAELRENQAARQLADLQSQVQKAKQQFSQLHDYRLEYQQRWQATAQEGTTGQGIRQFASFMRDLDHAIEMQQQQVVFVEQQFNQAMMAWQETYARRKAMGQLVERVRGEEDIAGEKILQKEIDDQVGCNFRGIQLEGK